MNEAERNVAMDELEAAREEVGHAEMTLVDAETEVDNTRHDLQAMEKRVHDIEQMFPEMRYGGNP